MKFRGSIKSLAIGFFFISIGNLYAANGDLIVNGNITVGGTIKYADNSTQTTAWLPAGTIIMFGGSTAPTGWLICDGSAVSRTTYANLFSVIGTTFGTGDGSTTFNLPDFRRRVAVGAGGTGTSVLANTVGSRGGEEQHTLTIAEMPSHNHSVSSNIATFGGVGASNVYGGDWDYSTAYTSIRIGNTGGGGSHNIIQPSLIVNHIIKY